MTAERWEQIESLYHAAHDLIGAGGMGEVYRIPG